MRFETGSYSGAQADLYPVAIPLLQTLTLCFGLFLVFVSAVVLNFGSWNINASA